MRKNLFCLLLTLVALLASVAPAYAAERSLRLESIVLIPSKGVVFTFIPQGQFKAAELTGTTRIDGQNYSLSCRFNDEHKVKCAADSGLAHLVGLVATGQVAGYDFSGLIRSPGTAYCYKIFEPQGGSWQTVATFCGAAAARQGDWILYRGVVATFDPLGPAGAGFYLEGKAGR